MLVTHKSPMGVLDVPSLFRGDWAAGEEVEVTEDQARSLLAQHELFFPADPAAEAIAAELAAASAEPLVDALPEPDANPDDDEDEL